MFKLWTFKFLYQLTIWLKRFFSYKFINRIQQKLKMSILYRTDRLEWVKEHVRVKGVKFGKNCRFFTREFSSEPYLVEIGDNVCIASGCQFITHDGGAWIFYNWEDHSKDKNVFNKICIGNNCFIGINCTILPGTVIGDNCVVGAGSVLRGSFASDSIIMGNPAKIIMKTSFYKKMIGSNKNFINANLYDIDNEHKDLIVKKHFGIDM